MTATGSPPNARKQPLLLKRLLSKNIADLDLHKRRMRKKVTFLLPDKSPQKVFSWEEYTRDAADQVIVNCLATALSYPNFLDREETSYMLYDRCLGRLHHPPDIMRPSSPRLQPKIDDPFFYPNGDLPSRSYDLRGDGWSVDEPLWMYNSDIWNEEKQLIDTDLSDIVLPMACAYVHSTCWLPRLQRFRRLQWRWFFSIKQELDEGAFVSEISGFADRVASDDWNYEDGFEFWKSSDTAHGYDFTKNTVLSSLVKYFQAIKFLIDDLHLCFDRDAPLSAEVIIRKRMWEGMVVDWVQADDSKEQAYLELYGETYGELAWYNNFRAVEKFDQRAYSRCFWGPD
jgi:hypothetical protein